MTTTATPHRKPAPLGPHAPAGCEWHTAHLNPTEDRCTRQPVAWFREGEHTDWIAVCKPCARALAWDGSLIAWPAAVLGPWMKSSQWFNDRWNKAGEFDSRNEWPSPGTNW